MRPFIKIFVVLLLGVAFGCASLQEQPLQKQTQVTKYIAFEFYSDPPGAYIYGLDGLYWGQTSESQPVRRVWGPGGDDSQYSVTAKKRGYKTVYHIFRIEYKYRSKPEAEMHYEKIVIVLNPE